MLEFDPLKSARQEIDDETRALVAEGRRRIREHEQMCPVVDAAGTLLGYRGRHQMPTIEEMERFWAEPSFALYTPSEKDRRGLENELRDLERDAELMRKHEQVRYE